MGQLGKLLFWYNLLCCIWIHAAASTVYKSCILCFSVDAEGKDASLDAPQPSPALPRTSSRTKVNPYSVIDISPMQQLEQQQGPSSSTSSLTESKLQEEEGRDILTSSSSITSGYSVPVPCGYATPSGVPLITPAYTTPVIIRHLSMDEDGKVESVTRES